MSEPDFRKMGDPLNDRLPPRRQWLQAGAPNYPLARDAFVTVDEIDALRASLTALVVAAGRMRDGWAEGDDAYRKQLWQALHQAADDADERHGIYPL